MKSLAVKKKEGKQSLVLSSKEEFPWWTLLPGVPGADTEGSPEGCRNRK